MLQQLRKGMELYGLVNLMAVNPEACHSLFVPGKILKVSINIAASVWSKDSPLICTVVIQYLLVLNEQYIYNIIYFISLFTARRWFHYDELPTTFQWKRDI